MATTLPEDQRLVGISPKAYEHPADRAATAALKSVPMLDTVVRKLIEYGYERALRQALLAGSVRIGEDQLPEVWADYRAALARLDIEQVPDLYLTQFPITNAAAIGSQRPIVLLNSATVNVLDEMELRTVLGHEAGHVLSDHVLYTTALIILMNVSGMALGPIMALPLMAVRLILLEWFRAAELSCDRAATLVNRDPLITARTMMVMAGGASSKKLNLDAFIRQASEYEDLEPGFDRLSRMRSELFLTHDYPVKRVSEIMKWVRSGEYDRIVKGDFRTRDESPDAKAEASAAADYYTERFKGIMRDATEGLAKVGEQAGEAADKLSDWIRNRRAGGPR